MPTIPGATRIKPEEAQQLLEAALKLLSKYAAELNTIDGGTRKQYKTPEQWKFDAYL